MVHAIQIVKCNKGHNLSITFDENQCGCHHEGKSCITLSCNECFAESFKTNQSDLTKVEKEVEIVIPLDDEGTEAIKTLLEGVCKR